MQEVLQDLIKYCCEQFASKQVQAIIIKRAPLQEVSKPFSPYLAPIGDSALARSHWRQDMRATKTWLCAGDVRSHCYHGTNEVLQHVAFHDMSSAGSAESRFAGAQVNAFAAGFMAHPDMLAVTKDTFGNYVTQCILVHADNDHRLALARLLMPHMLELAQHEYGTRVLQSAIEVCFPPYPAVRLSQASPLPCLSSRCRGTQLQ